MLTNSNTSPVNIFTAIMLPIIVFTATIAELHEWNRSGFLLSRKMRYLAYFFQFWINLTTWSFGLFEVTVGYNPPLLRTILTVPLIIAGLVLGLTNYIPRNPPFSLRRKVFVFTTFVLSALLLKAPLPKFISPSAGSWMFVVCGILCIQGITRSIEQLIKSVRTDESEKK